MPRIKRYKLTYFRTPGSPAATGVPTAYLRDVIEEKLIEVGKNLDPDFGQHNTNGSRWNGALSIVAERASLLINRDLPTPVTTPEAMYRRISGILAEESDITDLGNADAILLACEHNINRVAIPVFPGGKEAAREMVESYLDATGKLMTVEARDALIHALDRFALGFANGPRIFNDPTAKKREQQRNRIAKLRRAREGRIAPRPRRRTPQTPVV